MISGKIELWKKNTTDLFLFVSFHSNILILWNDDMEIIYAVMWKYRIIINFKILYLIIII